MKKTTKTYKLSHSSLLLAIFSLFAFNSAHAEYGLNLTKGVTQFSEEVYGLHMTVFWVCVVIAILVFGAMIYSMFAHRKSKGVTAEQFSHSTKAEIIWTVVPIIILIVIAFPSTEALLKMEAPTNDNNEKISMEMTIKVTGYQWKWKYDYLDEGISFLSTLDPKSNIARQVGSNIDPNTVDNYLLDVDKPLVIPANTNIRVLLTADDVIHSWWVPEFGWKRDAIPGYVNEAWTNVKKPGTYRGQCAELCGKDHGFMPIVVIVKTKAEYAQWVEEQKTAQMADEINNDKLWAQNDLINKGKTIYEAQCISCHQSSGQGLANTFPALNGSDVVNGPIEEQIKTVVFGKKGTAMKGFGNTLSESEIAAAITYTRNAWSNTAKDLVQPKDVKRIKNS